METDPQAPTPEWHAEQRRRDAEDIASGVRTPEQVNRDNGWIPDPEAFELVNLFSENRLSKKYR